MTKNIEKMKIRIESNNHFRRLTYPNPANKPTL